MTLRKLKTDDFHVQSTAAIAVKLGRELGERIVRMRDTPVGDLPQSCLSATLRRLENGEVTDGRDLTTLEALHFGLAERLSQEMVGSRIEPRLIGCDQDGEIWNFAEVPVYSGRGNDALHAYDLLERFLEVRQQVLDRANAEQLTLRLLR